MNEENLDKGQENMRETSSDLPVYESYLYHMCGIEHLLIQSPSCTTFCSSRD